MSHEIPIRFLDTTFPQTSSRDFLSIWHRNLTSRQVLATLDLQRLSDIGLIEAQRDSEIAKPFWR